MLGQKLKQLRKSRNLKQDDVAHLFGISRGSVSNWEKDRRKPNINQLEVLANFYNVSLDFFAEDVKKDEVVELLDRARKIMSDASVPNEKKEELYQEIMRLYLTLKTK